MVTLQRRTCDSIACPRCHCQYNTEVNQIQVAHSCTVNKALSICNQVCNVRQRKNFVHISNLNLSRQWRTRVANVGRKEKFWAFHMLLYARETRNVVSWPNGPGLREVWTHLGYQKITILTTIWSNDALPCPYLCQESRIRNLNRSVAQTTWVNMFCYRLLQTESFHLMASVLGQTQAFLHIRVLES